MNFPFRVEPACFVARPNRFLVLAELADGCVVRAHCADPGRLRELLRPGVTVYVSPAGRVDRRTSYDLRFVVHPESGTLVSLDSRLPNMVVAEALAAGRLPMFARYTQFRAEVRVPVSLGGPVHSRVDFVLVDSEGLRCWLEVKSVTLVVNGRAEFPDAPTVRGVRHLRELAQLARPERGGRLSCLWCSATTPRCWQRGGRPIQPSPMPWPMLMRRVWGSMPTPACLLNPPLS